MKKMYKTNLGGRILEVEFGELAKQADAAVLVKYGDTVVLSVAQSSKKPTELDYLPLMVMYNEKMYAAGKIPGGFFKREGRPSTKETLASRVIDRTLRPLFPDGFNYDVQIINTVLSSDADNSSEIAALIGSSIALAISKIPFNGPIAGVVVGYIDGEYVINPTSEQLETSSIDLTVAGTKDAVNMVEAGAKQVSEEEMINAIIFGHEEIKKIVTFIENIQSEIGVEKIEFNAYCPAEHIIELVTPYTEKINEIVNNTNKIVRNELLQQTLEEIVEKNLEASEEDLKSIKYVFNTIVKERVRHMILKGKKRPDGRKTDEIRPLNSQIDILPRTHGSALFTRGETQCLAIATLGSLSDYQIIDGLNEEEEKKRFMLHYNFPQFSVGETGRYFGASRREIGHGMLGERALSMVMPNEEDFPYTVRIVSEILESNGSTSQASICAGSMALMASGVPIKAPVAGIAMGLVADETDYTVLSDIQGLEDHLGDMDFKVAGTAQGITALQMDIKIAGLSKEILSTALHQAKTGRDLIMKNMLETISTPRDEVSEYAPKVMLLKIKPTQIRDVIGSGGKTITAIIEKCNNVKIDIDDYGNVTVMHQDIAPIKKAISIIEDLTREAEVNQTYLGTVKRIEKFGCFVELWPGVEGLVHISKLDFKRVQKVEDIVKIGDQITVKVIKIDEQGRVDLSRKDALPKSEKLDK